MRLGIVVPCYNEEEIVKETARRLSALVDRLIEKGKISNDSLIYLVDDGSTDKTWEYIEELFAGNRQISGIKLSRNFGHQNALLAGLFTASGDALVTIDGDLQDDIEVIEEMIDRYNEGGQIVYGTRKRRDTDTAFKNLSAQAFYRLMQSLGTQVIAQHADYRLMSRKAVEELKEFREVNLFLRGIVPLIGFKSSIVYYDRQARLGGETKYPLGKMLSFAFDGISSFSIVPLRIITIIGFVIFLFSILISAWALGIKIFTDQAIPGWTSTVLPTYLLGGIQILCIGIIGEYLGKTYKEVKARPRYIIEKMVE